MTTPRKKTPHGKRARFNPIKSEALFINLTPEELSLLETMAYRLGVNRQEALRILIRQSVGSPQGTCVA